MLTSILNGNGLVASGKNSILFVKDNFMTMAKLRAGYSTVCWFVGIAAYIGTCGLLFFIDIGPEEEKIYAHIYEFYLLGTVPIAISLSIIMLLRLISVLALCDSYSDYLESKDMAPTLPGSNSRGTSAMVAFGLVCFMLGVAYLWRDAPGMTQLLATPQ